MRNEFEKRLKQKNPKIWLLWLLGTSTGLRVSDLLKLRVTDITKSTFTIIETKTGKQKVVKIPYSVHSKILNHVERFKMPLESFLFHGRDIYRAYTRQSVWRILRGIGHEIDLFHIGSHSMRKTFAKDYYAKTRDMRKLQKELNHDHVETTVFYLLNFDNF